MANADRRKLKHIYQKAMAVTTAVVNAWDPYLPIAGGAPKDEFELEVSRIVAKAHEANTPEALARMVAEIFSATIESEPFTTEVCLPVATRLFAQLRTLGFVEQQKPCDQLDATR